MFSRARARGRDGFIGGETGFAPRSARCDDDEPTGEAGGRGVATGFQAGNEMCDAMCIDAM